MNESTAFSKVVRDIGDVQSRLFDHRPFTQGEAKFLLQEFEEKRKEREVQYMFEMLEMVTDIRETQIEKAVKLADMHLCHLTAHYEVAIRMCKNILERGESDRNVKMDKIDEEKAAVPDLNLNPLEEAEKEKIKDLKKILEQRREQRKQEWIAFIDDLQAKSAAVNETFANKEQELKNHYNKLEIAMHISPEHSHNSSKD